MTQTMTDWKAVDNGIADPNWYANGEPYDVLARLQREDPVHWTEPESYGRSFWTVTSYEHCLEVLTDSVHYSTYRDIRLPRSVDRLTTTTLHSVAADASLPMMEPPLHTLYRQPIAKYFSVPSIKRMRERTDAIVDDLISKAADKGRTEFVEELAGDVPMHVVLEFLGVPRSDWERIRALVWKSFAPADPRYAVPGQTPQETHMQARREIAKYSAALAVEKRANPADDFASILAGLKVERVPLDDHEMAAWITTVITGGLETTRNAMAVGLWLFHQHPFQRDLLLNEPDLIESAVDEIFRWVTPARSRMRVVRYDTELGGRGLKAGEWVVPMISTANRDPKVFENPNTFDIRRDPNPYLSFGEGIHKCLGRHLAKLELMVFFPKFLKAFPEFSIRDAEHPDWVVDHVVNGFSTLHVDLGPSALSPRLVA